jgi:ubiquinone/menaquinone biosynthesis C-methylase UbiE
MGFYSRRVLPRITNLTLSGRHHVRLRARATASLSGEVLEIGFGSGRNVEHYPSAVERVLAVDPATEGRKLAAERVAASAVPVEYIGLEGEQLPLAEASVDHVLSTWTLCTVPGVERALSEIRRVLRPGGQLHFVEHGRSPDASVARWQDRLTPWQRRALGGCHLNRSIDELIRAAGLRIERLETSYFPGIPKVFGYTFEGIASCA